MQRHRQNRGAAQPTDAELTVLRVLWQEGPRTVREVHDAIGKAKGVGYTTVLKQMQVMQRKGLVIRSERFRAHVYEAGVSRDMTQRQLTDSLLTKAFGGSMRSLLQSALAGHRVSEEELAAIRRLLDDHLQGRR